MSPTRCSCKGTLPESCNCTISDTSTIDVSGAGSAASPYTLAPILAADPGLLSCESDGLLGKWPDDVLSVPRVKVWRKTFQQQAGMPGTMVVEFEEEVVQDTGNFWNPATPTRLTNNFGVTALFGFGATIEKEMSPLSVNETWTISFRINGTDFLMGKTRAAVNGLYNAEGNEGSTASIIGIQDTMSIYFETTLAAGTYVEVLVSTTYTADLLLQSVPRLAPMFWMTYIGL